MDVLLLASYLVAFFTDAGIAFAVGYKLGPERARRLITGDAEYIATKAAIEGVQRDMLVVRHDFEAMRDTIMQSQRNTERTVTEALKSLPSPTLNATIPMTVQLEDAIQRQVRQVLRASMKEVEDALLKRMEELGKGKGGGPLSAEQATALAEQAEVEEYIDALAVQAGIPHVVLPIAKRMGRLGIAWLDEKYQLGLQEVVR